MDERTCSYNINEERIERSRVVLTCSSEDTVWEILNREVIIRCNLNETHCIQINVVDVVLMVREEIAGVLEKCNLAYWVYKVFTYI